MRSFLANLVNHLFLKIRKFTIRFCYIDAILNFSNPRGLTTGSIKWSSMNGYRGQATVIRKFGEVENGVILYQLNYIEQCSTFQLI